MRRKNINLINFFMLIFFSFTILPLSNVRAADSVAVPTGLTAIPASQYSGANIFLSWEAAVNATSYNIYRSDDGGTNYTLIGSSTTITNNIATYKDSTVALGKSYYYKVSSVNAAGESAETEAATATIYAPIYKFDIGEKNDAEGYTFIGSGHSSTVTTYTDALGYGFVGTPGGNSRDRGAGQPNGVYSDFAVVDGISFKVKLPIGKYSINFISGSMNTDSAGALNVIIGGQTVTTISYGKGQVNEGYAVTSVTSEDPLEMKFSGGTNARLNGMIITPMGYGPTELTQSELNVSATPSYSTLTWAAPQDAISYNIYRKALGDNTYTKIGSSTTTTYKDESVVVGRTYMYYVTAVSLNGEAASAAKEIQVLDKSVAVPAVPVDLTAKREPAATTLTWAKDENVLFYNIYQKISTESDYMIIGSIEPDSASTLLFKDENLTEYLNYDYKVTAANRGGESLPAAVNSNAPIPAVPAKVIVDKAGWSVVELTSSSTNLAIGCNVYRADTIDGTYTLLGKATKANNDYHYKDTALTPEKDYFYKFAAFNYTGESEKTEAVKVTTKKVIDKPDAPIGLTLNSMTVSGTTTKTYKVRIDWSYTYGATSYNVYRSTSTDGTFTKIGTSTNGLYIDSIVGAENAIYYYKVSAVNTSGESALSEVIAAKLSSTFRAVPTALAVTSQTYSPASVNLTWAAVTGATSYNVYRAAKVDYAYSKIGTSTNGTYADTTANLGVEYLYKVTAVDENGESLKSAEVSCKLADASVPVLSETVKELNYSYEDNELLKLKWSPIKDATSYNIYKSLYKDGKYAYVGSTTDHKYNDEKSVDSATYYYKIVAVNAGGEASAFETLTVTAKVTLKRQMEKIDRGINAVKAANGVLVSWRLLGTESQNLAFNLYRDGVKINSKPITNSTNYLDTKGTTASKYYVRAVEKNVEREPSETVSAWEDNFREIPIKKPAANVNKAGEIYDYSANDASVADLDGDGKYEIVLNWQPTNAKDNSQGGYTGNVYIDAYELDGTFMWRIDLGKNIRAGAHYNDIMVYDFDGDGKAELTTRTADGTVDGLGNIIGDEDKDYRNASGYVLDGPEYHTMFEGATGKALDTAVYEPQRGALATDTNEWGDTYGNRGDRFIASVAYLDGKTPSVVMQRGYYTRMAIVAYGWKDGKFVHQWTFDSQADEVDPNGLKYTEYRGQGNHQVSVADVDGDGMDEVITGASVINENGKALYTTKLGHGDAMHVGDLDPTRPGLEIYQVQEDTKAEYGMDIRDAGTGEILFGLKTGRDTGRGVSADIDPNYIGEEIWAIDGEWNSTTGGVYSARGEKISDTIPASNFAIWWDGDLQREILDHNWVGYTTPPTPAPGTISKWDYVNKKSVNILTAEGTSSNNGTKGNPCLQADLFGDWREEVIWRTGDNSALRIYATTDVTETKLSTLMHDPIYRLGVAWQNTGYNQPPHTSYYLGSGMTTPPQPNITMQAGGEEVENKNKDLR